MKITDLKPNEVIHCKTKEEAVRICGLAQACKLKARNILLPRLWNIHKEETCYFPIKGGYGDMRFAEEHGYTIHPSELFQNSSDSFDEINEDGLRARGFEKPTVDRDEFSLDNGRYFALTSNISRVFLRAGGQYETPTNCQTLTDIDHLIRLLGI